MTYRANCLWPRRAKPNRSRSIGGERSRRIPLQDLCRQLDVAPIFRIERIDLCQHVVLVGALPRRRTLQGRDKLTPRSDVCVPGLDRRHVREDELQPTRWLRDRSQGRAQDNMKRRDVEAPPVIALRSSFDSLQMFPLEEDVANVDGQLHHQYWRMEPTILVSHPYHEPGALFVDG